ncbi:MAG: anthranilate synthase component I family protein [Pseudobacteriovorax sp.]|nr:anthranilate synthase component I family protein [Pseudobacteriovorax sp.]
MNKEKFDEIISLGYNQVPLIKKVPMEEITPQQFLASCQSKEKILLESTRVSPIDGRYSILVTKYKHKFEAKGQRYKLDGKTYQSDPISGLRTLMNRFKGYKPKNSPKFLGGAVGFFSYESNHYFEKLPRNKNDDLGIPDICFLITEQTLVFDHIENEILLISSGDDYKKCVEELDSLENLVKETALSINTYNTSSKVGNETAQYESNFKKREYIETVKKVQEHILNGDTYQTNLSQRLSVNLEWTPEELYKRMSQVSPVHFASFLDFEDFKIVSASPERLVSLDQEGKLKTRPIAGTRRRGTEDEEKEFINELKQDEKERAEHCMLVDLERNDLGRVSKFGSVEVSSLMEIVKYSKVIHIESEVVGVLADSKDFLDVIAALFPGGTITGVPKIKTMEIINQLEPNTRSIYTGSIGYISFAQEMDLNIVIRTALIKDSKAYVNVGGGVVIDGDPEKEYKETINKAKSALTALNKEKVV